MVHRRGKDKGEHMEHMGAHKSYESKGDVIAYLKTFFRPDIDRGVRVVEVYRSPGTFIHEYLVGSLSLEQIVKTVKKHPEACFCCMDERVKVKGVVTSHRGCGAAAIAADLVKHDPEFRAKYAEVVGEEKTTRLLKALETAEGESLALAKDAFGAEWSRALAHLAGLPDKYEHLDIDDTHHYASMAVLDLAGNLMVDTEGQFGERPFVISNPKKVVEKVPREVAYGSLIDYGLLALKIARGSHSSLPPEMPFTITVVRNERVDEKVWNELWERKTKQLEADWAKTQAQLPPQERRKLNYRVVVVMDSELQDTEAAVR